VEVPKVQGVIIKQPVAYDTSYWEGVPDFGAINPRPLYVATRATLGLTYTDPTFVRYFTDLGYDNIRRGAYHAFKHGYDPKQQAYHFISVVEPYVTEKDVLELDFEGGNETAAELLIWLNQVRARFPDNLIMVYSRKNLADPIAKTMTATQKAQMRQYPFWTAGYPANPDLLNAPRPDYIPDQSAFGPVWMWQYSDQAIVDGIKGEVDVNWLSTEFQQFLGNVVTPSDVTTPLYDGVTQITGTRNGWRWWLHRGDPAKVRYETACESTVSYAAKARGAQLAWNGSDFDRVTRTLHRGSPSFYCDGPDYVRNDSYGDVCAVRPLIVDGVMVDMNSGEAKWTEGHSRTIFGKTADGRLMHFTSEGVYPNQGLTFKECATIMQKYGAVLAGDAGGGGDTTLVIEGELQNIPEDIDNGVHVERRIPQVLLAYVGTRKEETMATYKALADAKVWSTYAGGSFSNQVAVIRAGTQVTADRVDSTAMKLSGGGYTKNSWFVSIATPPVTPPVTPPSTVTVTHVIKVYSDGKVSIDDGTPA
jgi:GH25 family lysozyme M1 (1,4-beta-N-acetylmuramidase)